MTTLTALEIFEHEVSKSNEEDWNLPLMFQAYKEWNSVLLEFDEFFLERRNPFITYLVSQIGEEVFRKLNDVWGTLSEFMEDDRLYDAMEDACEKQGIDGATYRCWEGYYS